MIVIMDVKTKTRERLAKLLNMLRSPVPGERDAAVTKINELMDGRDWEEVLGTTHGVTRIPIFHRPAPERRPLTPEEILTITGLLAEQCKRSNIFRLSDSDLRCCAHGCAAATSPTHKPRS